MLQKNGEPTRKYRLNGCIEQLSFFLKKMEDVFHEDIFEPTKSSGIASRRCRRYPYNRGLFAVLIL
jgi:hypothetical protein